MAALSLGDNGPCNSRAYPLRLGHCALLPTVPQSTFGLAHAPPRRLVAMPLAGCRNILPLSGV